MPLPRRVRHRIGAGTLALSGPTRHERTAYGAERRPENDPRPGLASSALVTRRRVQREDPRGAADDDPQVQAAKRDAAGRAPDPATTGRGRSRHRASERGLAVPVV